MSKSSVGLQTPLFWRIMISLHEFGPSGNGSLSEEEHALLEKFRACEDIVHGWDDPADFSMWKKVFAEALAP